MGMTDKQIDDLAKKHLVLRKFYKGCFAVDKYPTKFEPNSVYFLNTSTRKKSAVDGHWVILYVSFNKFIVYVDSAGLPPRDQLAKRLSKDKAYVYNKDILQHPSSDSCGRWALLFAVSLARGKPMHDIKAHFTRDLLRNEKVLVQMYAREFD